MKIIDARGLACPRPVILSKKAIRDENLTELLVKVDNEIATQNLSKMGTQLGFTAKVEKESEGNYEVTLSKRDESLCEIMFEGDKSEYIVAISSDEMGRGDEVFSKTLLEGFIYALREQDILPKYVVLYNLGVKLTTINKSTVEDLKYLEEQGTEVVSCGLCLDNYNLKEELKVGSITNMYRICELLRLYKVVSPC
ncbi:sulfurtransferase-like selenium metabolism protein YedF [Anaerosphaera multitolerans]|uniref:Sulfurtransferase-like selenium metabolism protein YedF n=1 Tax=Anaerosphaera multitolerans TaxID=2487351 RepID=A0A437S8R8_9FIRM|nr:sulfurtransferase-like selenium metabolism protein YedF [Anaerosphaera multitolerans]RVU55499.1 sulfurtransferase-like selenium metabolism protein YedF [Anaerosphaera multitolerans]